MPRTDRLTSPEQTSRRLSDLIAAAMPFAARDRGEIIIRKWIGAVDLNSLPEARAEVVIADTTLLAMDLMVLMPSISGSTAVDRLARKGGVAPQDLTALRQARFRLLRLDRQDGASHAMQDAMSGEALRILNAELPALPAGTMLFGRVAMLGPGLGCLPGIVTPLDEAATAAARQHAGPGQRWAEAVYAHVVRHGTLDVPGLNRPAEDAALPDDATLRQMGPLYAAAVDWAALQGGAPDATLLQRTRELANLDNAVAVVALTVAAREAGDAPRAAGMERVALVLLETIRLRERSSAGRLTLAMVGQAVDAEVAAGHAPQGTAALFVALRQRLTGSDAKRADDPGLERLVARIQALRAKTVAQGCTEQEALAAAEKVAELLDRHGLSLGELDFRAQPCEGIGVETGRKRFGPIDDCVSAIAAFFDCRVWAEQSRHAALRYVFFGLRGDVTAAHYLYELVEQAFATETRTFQSGPIYAGMAGARRQATSSFQIGLGDGIRTKLHSLRAARAAAQRGSGGRDLVPVKSAMVDEEMARLGLATRQRCGTGGRQVLSDAFAAGTAAGERFEVTPAIGRAG